MNFIDIEYLKNGTARQQSAFKILSDNLMLEKLQAFTPVLVGTIPIKIDIESSDLDIICCFTDSEQFAKIITENFHTEKDFSIRSEIFSGNHTVIANFIKDGFEFELFGQNIPVNEQLAYRHMIIEHNLLTKYGEDFRQQIITLKKQGHKTEPAFAIALGLTGDPYVELLKFESELNKH